MSAPLFTARIDHARATIRAPGRLDHVSADLLRGTVETLQRDGHGAITLDLAQLTEPDTNGVRDHRVVAADTRGHADASGNNPMITAG